MFKCLLKSVSDLPNFSAKLHLTIICDRKMSLQTYLEQKFNSWQPKAAEVLHRGKGDITLSWKQNTFDFVCEDLLYRVQRKEKIPPWVYVYSGGKTSKRIYNLAPCSPHKFRVQVILKSEAVPLLAAKAAAYYGSEEAVYEHFTGEEFVGANGKDRGDVASCDSVVEDICGKKRSRGWLESQWSEETCTSTESEGTSVVCFCMAVRGGYLKQVQILLEERPALIGIINSTTGLTPLATAVRKGDLNMAKFLLSAGAEVDQHSFTQQTPLHLAVLGADPAMVEMLIDRGADFSARDINSLRVEHFAVDSGSVPMVQLIFERGGDVHVTDSNGWTPLFRAICQNASSSLVAELISLGSDVSVVDRAGLSLTAAARLLRDRLGRERESVMRLVDSQFPREKALANFTRLTKKISSLHTLFKTN